MSETISQDVTIKGEGNIVVGKGDVTIHPLPPAEARTRADLSILVKNVETTWIKGVLEQSVHEAALLELGIEIRADAVDHPWQTVLEAPDQPRQVLPKGTKIKAIFDEANRLLLILGEPGSGKTTTLLQLARELMAEVDPAFTQPVPVIFNLSTWTDKQQPLAEWLIAELNSKYRTPKKLGRRWLEERRILPLLDGLDEVKAENRAACVEQINRLAVDYGLQGMAVCSRIKDYTVLDVRLQFDRAIYLQPLTSEQIDEYFERAGDKLASLRAALRQDETLQNLAQSPLMLNIMSLAYQDSSAEALSTPVLATDEARRRHLFDTYIARMFKRKGGRWPYEAVQTREWLSWLARNMQLHNQEVFLIEALQPSWLQARLWRFAYTLASRVLGGLIVGLIAGLSVGLSGGLIIGLTVSIIDILRFEWLDKRRDRTVVPHFWWSVINTAIVGLIVGLVFGLIVELRVGLSEGLSEVLGVGLVFGLIFGIRGSRQSLMNDIQTVEALRWSWGKALKGGLIGGLSFGLIGGLIGGLSFGLSAGLIGGLIGGLLGGLLGAVFNGLSREVIETKTTPNQGIRLSARNAVFGGLSVGLSVGLGGGLSYGLSFGLSEGLSNGLSFGLNEGLSFGLSFGLIVGPLGALWYGGLDIIQHYTLRLILMIQGHTPRHYARFFDYSAHLIFLQKVGGGYRFIHRLLLEHFAEMNIEGKQLE